MQIIYLYVELLKYYIVGVWCREWFMSANNLFIYNEHGRGARRFFVSRSRRKNKKNPARNFASRRSIFEFTLSPNISKSY